MKTLEERANSSSPFEPHELQQLLRFGGYTEIANNVKV